MRRPYTPRSPVFLTLPAADLAALDAMGTRLSYQGKTDIYRQGDPSHRLYRVIAGRVNLVATSLDGREMIVRVMFAGDILGLSAAISHVDYEVSASTAITSYLQAIPTPAFMNLMESAPAAMGCVARALAEEYLDIVERAQILQLSGSTPARLARVLLECAPGDNPRSPFLFAFTHAEVANMVGCSRESVSRTFGCFQRSQFIEVERHVVTILKPDSLLRVN